MSKPRSDAPRSVRGWPVWACTCSTGRCPLPAYTLLCPSKEELRGGHRGERGLFLGMLSEQGVEIKLLALDSNQDRSHRSPLPWRGWQWKLMLSEVFQGVPVLRIGLGNGAEQPHEVGDRAGQRFGAFECDATKLAV